MTPTTREQLVAMMARAGDVADYKAEVMLDAMIAAGLVVVPAQHTTEQWMAMDRTAVVDQDWRGMTAPFVNGLGAAYDAAITAGRIDGGGKVGA